MKRWHQQYAEQGFVVIGVHSPEFSHEREVENVRHCVKDHDISFAVPVDNDFSTWNKYGNRYWPAMRFSHLCTGAHEFKTRLCGAQKCFLSR